MAETRNNPYQRNIKKGPVKHTLKDIRWERGLTQRDLARRSGVQGPHISMIENGRRKPNWLTRQKLALALNCQPADLVPINDTAHTTDTDRVLAVLDRGTAA